MPEDDTCPLVGTLEEVMVAADGQVCLVVGTSNLKALVPLSETALLQLPEALGRALAASRRMKRHLSPLAPPVTAH